VTDALSLLQEQDWVRESSIFGRSLHVGAELPEETAAERIRGVLAGGGIEVDRVDPILPSLEDVFIHVISRQTEGGQS
jgi:ABC-2 type transport system ATP-binding protein